MFVRLSPSRSRLALGFAALVLLSVTSCFAQMIPPATPLAAEIDAALAAYIASIDAIDNHAHPVLPPPNDTTDRGFDALPVDDMVPQTDPVAWRPDNPQLPLAWQALWGLSLAVPLDAAGQQQLNAARSAVKSREGQHYAQWVLDQSHIQTMLANRVSLGPGIATPRFRWVPYADALIFPLDNSGLGAVNPDRKQFFTLEDQLRTRYLAAVHRTAIPATLSAYLNEVVTPTLERERREGAVAEKFEVAYLRSFDFSNPPQAEAARVYARFAQDGVPDSADYKLLQDFLFRFIARESGRLGMAIHLHTMAGGGSYFDIAGGNPLLLEPVFDDPSLRSTNFVLLHGGWPFVHEAGALLQKPNVYLDLSQQSLDIPPRTLATWLREWLELYPDKVLFATDGYPYSSSMGWEESSWLSTYNLRIALGLALTGMLHDGELDAPRARLIARAVLQQTATALYHLR